MMTIFGIKQVGGICEYLQVLEDDPESLCLSWLKCESCQFWDHAFGCAMVEVDHSAYEKLAIKRLSNGGNQQERWPWKQIWKVITPLKVTCFAWLVAHKACLTHENSAKVFSLQWSPVR